jgi:hypothetical protein
VDVYLEAGTKRVFAAALDWPGWIRSGADEDSALEALAAYGARYAAAIRGAGVAFEPPAASSFAVVERLTGNATTDFGAPGQVPSADRSAVDAAELGRLEAILEAVWASFDTGVAAARGAPLRGGPRGGGRSLDKIVGHVCDAERGYLRTVGGSLEPPGTDEAGRLHAVHEAFLGALGARARGELPDRGPRGGMRWPARYAARRAAWHVLDHLWEIEDRSE